MMSCKHINCPKKNKLSNIGSEKNAVFKYKLDPTDNENKYVLITGPVYLAKSSIDMTQDEDLQREYNLESANETEEKEILIHSEDFQEPEKEQNEFEMWQKRCNKGIFSIKELLYVCERDPDSIMAQCRKNWAKDKKEPTLAYLEDVSKEESLSQIKQTHGVIPGDAKYHFLMVDATTSMTVVGFEKESTHLVPLLKKTTHISMPGKETNDDVVSPEVTYLTEINLDMPTRQSKEERKPSIVRPKGVEQGARDSTKSEKRISTVVWSGIAVTSPSSSSDSGLGKRVTTLDEVAIEAAAEADDFRKNVQIKKHNALLGVIIEQEIKKPHGDRKSMIEHDQMPETDSDKTRPTRCCGLIKGKEKNVPPRTGFANQITTNEKKPSDSEDDHQSSSDTSSASSSVQSGLDTPNKSYSPSAVDRGKHRGKGTKRDVV